MKSLIELLDIYALLVYRLVFGPCAEKLGVVVRRCVCTKSQTTHSVETRGIQNTGHLAALVCHQRRALHKLIESLLEGV